MEQLRPASRSKHSILVNEGVQKILFATRCLRLAMKSFCYGDHTASQIAKNVTAWNTFSPAS